MDFLAGIYLSIGMAYVGQSPAPTCPTCGWYHDITQVENPYGVAELGWSKQWDQSSIDIALRHESSLATTKDHGLNSVEIRFRWNPFR